jgi:hypothetical protein
MQAIIRRFDRFLRRAQGVFEFWDDPGCMFRARVSKAPHTVRLHDTEIPAGAPVLELHFWNEHMPQIPAEGPSLSLALQGQRMLVTSLQKAAHHIRHDPCMNGVQAVGGATVLFTTGDGSGAEKLFMRLGFTAVPYQNPLGRFGEFWENLYTWGLMWAYNAVSLRQRHLIKLHRTELWMSVDAFLQRYGESRTKNESPDLEVAIS